MNDHELLDKNLNKLKEVLEDTLVLTMKLSETERDYKKIRRYEAIEMSIGELMSTIS